MLFMKISDCLRKDLPDIRSLGDNRLPGLRKLAEVRFSDDPLPQFGPSGLTAKIAVARWETAQRCLTAMQFLQKSRRKTAHGPFTASLRQPDHGIRLFMEKIAEQYAAWNNMPLGNNPFQANFWGYNQPGTWGKNNRDAARLDTKMDAMNARHRAAGRDARMLGHTYKMNGKPIDIQFPGVEQQTPFNKMQQMQTLDQMSGRSIPFHRLAPHNTIFDFKPVTLGDIRARQESDSYHFPQTPLHNVRSANNIFQSRYESTEGPGTVYVDQRAPLAVYAHEGGHHLARYLRPDVPADDTLYNTDFRHRILSEQLANEHAHLSRSKLSPQYQTPQNQFDYVLSRGLASHMQHPSGSQADVNKTLNKQRMGLLTNWEPSNMSKQYIDSLAECINHDNLRKSLNLQQDMPPSMLMPFPTKAYKADR